MADRKLLMAHQLVHHGADAAMVAVQRDEFASAVLAHDALLATSRDGRGGERDDHRGRHRRRQPI